MRGLEVILVVLWGIGACVAGAQEPVPEAPTEVLDKEAVTKFDGFTVVGNQQQIRGGIASMAGKMSSELATLTGEKGRELELPIIIQLYGQVGDKERKHQIVSKIEQVMGKYHLKIMIHLAKGVDYDRLRYHVMEMLLYERGLADGQSVAEGEHILVKPWLIVGMLEALDLKRGHANRKIYQMDLPYFQVLPLQKVFDASEMEWRAMDGRQSLTFRAISGAMVSSLLRQPDGRHGMGEYLADVATFKGEEENLMRQHFPSMNKSKTSLEKWADLEMAELGTAVVSQIYSLTETEKRLESALQLRYRDEEKSAVSVGIDAYAEVLKLESEDRINAVTGASKELQRLSYRCFPSYRPLMGEYEIILGEVAEGKDKGIAERLEKLADVRLKLKEAGLRARDYLDWYYITRSDDVSGEFKQYRDLSEALQLESVKPRGDDSTQLYLDGVQRLYGGR